VHPLHHSPLTLINCPFVIRESLWLSYKLTCGKKEQIKLNKAGDRIGGNYDFWTVGKDNETQSYKWKKEDNSK
jgi:hypothetical protein